VDRRQRHPRDGRVNRSGSFGFDSVGLSGSSITIGKLSGRRGLTSKLAELGYELEGEALDAIYRQAIALAEETFRVLGLVLSMRGQHDEAERVLREAEAMPGAGSYTTATLGYALARGGHRPEAERILHSVESASRLGYVSPVALATLHIGLGDHERALDEAERALEERRGWLAYLRVNPLMDPLRGEPRFDALIRRMAL